VVAVNSERAHTGMTSEALGVSVAPSFFQSCVSDGKTAKMEDVLRFKVKFSEIFSFTQNPISSPCTFSSWKFADNVAVSCLDCHARH